MRFKSGITRLRALSRLGESVVSSSVVEILFSDLPQEGKVQRLILDVGEDIVSLSLKLVTDS